MSPQRAFRRRRVALIGALAVLFQAVLFGWHNHPVPLAGRGPLPSVVAANGAAPLSPADAEDGCEICAALHHLSVSPIEFALLPMPTSDGSAPSVPARVLSVRTCQRGFHARAPPSGSDPIV